MKKLDDIPKHEFLKVPDGYFESLPGRIQSRISQLQPVTEQSVFLRYKLQFVAPAVVIILAWIAWFQSAHTSLQPELMLAEIDTEQLMTYLSESELSTEELVEAIEPIDLENIEDEIYQLEFESEDVDSVFIDAEIKTH